METPELKPRRTKGRSRKKKFWPEQEQVLSVPPEELTSAQFVNRELSWLEFNRRVLHEAADERTPLLERVRFLGIVSTNLDEFFMKRVGRLLRKIAAGYEAPSVDGMTSSEQMKAIRERIITLYKDQTECFSKLIQPELLKNGIQLLRSADLTAEERELAQQYFRQKVFAGLTPLAVDPGHPFPFISNLSTSLGVMVRHPDRDERFFARVKIPKTIPQWFQLKPGSATEGHRFFNLLDLIRDNLGELFPGMELLDVMTFRVTRNADLERDEEEAEDILEMIEQELYQRRFARVVRLEVGANTLPGMLRFIMDEIEVGEGDVYELPGDFEYASLAPLSELNLPHLKHRPWVPVTPPLLQEEESNILTIMRNQDLLVHHPYESFVSSVEKFVRQAVDDPKVLAIKMTIYRTGDNSPFMPLLIQAARAGKQVVCIVELTASFDEERNIYWAQALERAGVHVIYGIVGLKTHAKTILVVRQEADGLRTYAHIGTGNYHTHTSNIYTDMGLFTCNPEINSDLVNLFHHLTGRSVKTDYRALLVAPVNMRERFVSMIEREAEFAAKGVPSRIIFKVNALDEFAVCKALFKASKAGTKIDLIVRGPCILRPGTPGMSENIRVISVVGRLLEHSRIFYFRNGAENEIDGEFFIGSPDPMFRNFMARVEVVTPILEPGLKRKCWEVFQAMLADKRSAWDMQQDGTYRQRQPDESPESQIGTHERLMNAARQMASIESRAAESEIGMAQPVAPEQNNAASSRAETENRGNVLPFPGRS